MKSDAQAPDAKGSQAEGALSAQTIKAEVEARGKIDRCRFEALERWQNVEQPSGERGGLVLK
jgi:hypothetical protein